MIEDEKKLVNQIRIFTGKADALDELHEQVNTWLATMPRTNIVSITTNCALWEGISRDSMMGGDDSSAHFIVVTVNYIKKIENESDGPA